MGRFIWRLEYCDGAGFYNRSSRADFNGDNSLWPTPAHDFARHLINQTLLDVADASPYVEDDFYFGFTSLKQAKAWFADRKRGDEKRLRKYIRRKLHLVAYRRVDCTYIRESDHQCIFIPPPQRLDRRAVLPLHELWNGHKVADHASRVFIKATSQYSVELPVLFTAK